MSTPPAGGCMRALGPEVRGMECSVDIAESQCVGWPDPSGCRGVSSGHDAIRAHGRVTRQVGIGNWVLITTVVRVPWLARDRTGGISTMARRHSPFCPISTICPSRRGGTPRPYQAPLSDELELVRPARRQQGVSSQVASGPLDPTTPASHGRPVWDHQSLLGVYLWIVDCSSRAGGAVAAKGR